MRVLSFCILCFTFAPAAEAEAQVEVGVEVSGPGARAARGLIEEILSSHAEVGLSENAVVRLTGRIRAGRLRLVLQGPDGEVATVSFRARNRRALSRALRSRLWEEIGPPLLELSDVGDAPAAPAPSPAAVRSSPDLPAEALPASPARAVREPPSEAAPRERLVDTLRLSVGVGLYSRDFSYVDDIFLELRGYQLPAAPLIRIKGFWYPLVPLADLAIFESLGLLVDVQLPFGLETQVGDATYPTRSFDWSLGVVGRLPIDAHSASVSAAYAERGYFITRRSLEQPRLEVPDVHYRELRFDGDFWLDFGVLGIALRAGASVVVESGAIESPDWFRRNRSHGLAAGAELYVRLAGELHAALLFDWRGYFFDMRSEPGDARVAGGAIDHHIVSSLGLSYRLR